MATDRLTTVENVKEWVANSTSNDDTLITRMIDQASRLMLSWLDRPTLFQNTYTERYDGKGGERQFLANWPVLSVASVYVGNTSIPASANLATSGYQAGYYLNPAYSGRPPGSPQSIDLYGHRFHRGNGNVQITYTAGYVISNEAQTISAGTSSLYKIAVNAPYGIFGGDLGVTYSATGIALTPVAFTLTPPSGSYCFDKHGNYTFSSADNGLGILISYNYIPFDIEMAVREWLAERYEYSDRIGHKTKSLGGTEAMTYVISDIPTFVQLAAEPYRKVIFI